MLEAGVLSGLREAALKGLTPRRTTGIVKRVADTAETRYVRTPYTFPESTHTRHQSRRTDRRSARTRLALRSRTPRIEVQARAHSVPPSRVVNARASAARSAIRNPGSPQLTEPSVAPHRGPVWGCWLGPAEAMEIRFEEHHWVLDSESKSIPRAEASGAPSGAPRMASGAPRTSGVRTKGAIALQRRSPTVRKVPDFPQKAEGQHRCWPSSRGAGEGIRTLDVNLGKVALYR